MVFWKEQPTQPIRPRLRTNWSGGNFQIIDKVTGTLILEINATEDDVKALLSPGSVVPGQALVDGTVTPKKTSENWLEVGASIMADQKYSLLYYETGAVALSDPNDPIVGVAYNDAQIDPPDEIPIQEGLVNVIADGGVVNDESPLKAGWYGRVQLWRETPTTLEPDLAGEDDKFTDGHQPGATPGPVKIEQASNEATDAGRRVTVIGIDDSDDPISEVIELDDTDTTTRITGTEDFKNVTGVFFEKDADANINILRASDDETICTILSGSDNVGAPFMDTQTYAYCSKVRVVANEAATEWLTLVGLDPSSNDQLERLQLADDPGTITSDNDYRIVTRLITGELDNSRTHTVTAVADAAGDKVGKAMENATTDGDVIKAYIKPNLV